MTDFCVHALLAYNLGNGALLTHNKQVCTHMPVWSYRPVVGEHSIFGTIYLFPSFHLCINLMSFVLTKKLFIIIIIITKASMYKMSPKDKLGAQAVTVSLCLCLVLVHGLILRILAKLYECLNCEPLKVYTYWSKPHYCCIFVCKAL